MLEKHFLGPGGEPLAMPETGAHGFRFEYDALGEIAAETLLDARQAAVGRIVYSRNAYGQVTERRFQDREGRPAAHPKSGCAIERLEGYGTWGWDDPSLERCLDVAGRPVNRRDTGWATRKALMDAGQLVEKFLDAAGQPVKPRE